MPFPGAVTESVAWATPGTCQGLAFCFDARTRPNPVLLAKRLTHLRSVRPIRSEFGHQTRSHVTNAAVATDFASDVPPAQERVPPAAVESPPTGYSVDVGAAAESARTAQNGEDLRWNRSILPAVVGERGAVSDHPVLRTDPVEEHLHVTALEPAGEHRPVVGQDLAPCTM